MTNLFTTLVVKKNGKFSFDDREGIQRVLDDMVEGEERELTIESVGQKRTHAQNRFLHGPILKAFMKEGQHKQAAKDMLALLLIPDEIPMLDGSIVRVPGHTSALSKEEFTDFIDACLQLAAENNIHIEDAEEWRRKLAAA